MATMRMARALYAAADHAATLARASGIGAVGDQQLALRCGGAYAMALAQQGLAGSGLWQFRQPCAAPRRRGAVSWHQLIAIAFLPNPTHGSWIWRPALCPITVQLYASLGVTLPDDVASDAAGEHRPIT